MAVREATDTERTSLHQTCFVLSQVLIPEVEAFFCTVPASGYRVSSTAGRLRTVLQSTASWGHLPQRELACSLAHEWEKYTDGNREEFVLQQL